MITFDEITRQLVRLAQVDSVHPIPGADRIECATVGGWNVVVEKGAFQPNDPVVYFEVDTCLPLDDHRFSFLAGRGTVRTPDGTPYHRLRTMKLRGVYSQGLVLPAELFATELSMQRNDMLTAMRVGKWEDDIPVGANVVGSWSPLVQRTDSERVQNLHSVWNEIMGYTWYATEKIDGMSQTLLHTGEGYRLYSRNWEIAMDDKLSGRIAKDFIEGLPRGHGIQYELAGPGIQKNPLALPKPMAFVFTYYVDWVPQPRWHWPQWALDVSVPVLGDPYKHVIETGLRSGPRSLIDKVDGMKSLVNTSKLAEGVVMHTDTGERVPALGRNTFKVISNKYLTKTGS